MMLVFSVGSGWTGLYKVLLSMFLRSLVSHGCDAVI